MCVWLPLTVRVYGYVALAYFLKGTTMTVRKTHNAVDLSLNEDGAAWVLLYCLGKSQILGDGGLTNPQAPFNCSTPTTLPIN